MHGSYVTKWSFFSLSFFFFAHQAFGNVDILIMLRSQLLWYVCIKYGNNVTITLHMCSSK